MFCWARSILPRLLHSTENACCPGSPDLSKHTSLLLPLRSVVYPLRSGFHLMTVAPAQLKAGATVIKWKPDLSGYTTLRKGNNKLVCFDKSGLPGQQAFSVECSSLGNIERAQQNIKFESEPDRAKRQAALDAAEKDGTRAKPEFGSVWYHLMGASQDQAR